MTIWSNKITGAGRLTLRILCLTVGVVSGFLVFVVDDKEFWPVRVCLLSICLLCLWFFFRSHIARERVLMLFGVVSGIVVGTFAFFGGLLWAANQHPKSNIAPIMAFLFTGPLGFAVGAILGILLGVIVQKRQHRQP